MASPIESTEVYRRTCELGDEVWKVAKPWSAFDQNTLGSQLVKSLDSVAANLVEDDARGTDRDTARFFVSARASAREARHWLLVANRRGLIADATSERLVGRLTEAVKMINGLIAHRRSRVVNEALRPYDSSDDLSPFLTPDP